MTAVVLAAPSRPALRVVTPVAVVAACVPVGVALSRAGVPQSMAMLLCLSFVGGCIVLRWPVAIFAAAAAAVLLPLPGIQELKLPLLGGTLYLSDLLLPVAAVVACTRWRSPARAAVPAALALVVVLLGVGGFVLNGNPFKALLTDLRGPVHLLLGLLLGAVAVRDARVRATVVRAVGVILWISAAAAMVTALTGLHLVTGTVREVSTNIAGTYTGFGALRFQIAPSLAASVLLCVLVGFVLLHPDRAQVWSAVLRFGPPSLVLTFLSFSRNSLLALVLTVGFCVVVGARSGSGQHTVARILAWALLVLVGGLGLFAATELATQVAGGRRNPVESQVMAYNARVLDVLGGDNLKNDASASFRAEEDRYALAAIRRRPLTGGGFGAAYRPRFASDAFTDERGTRYAHNYYLWIAVKTGLGGLLTTLALFAWPVGRCLRRPRSARGGLAPEVLPLGAGLFGTLGMLFVAPAAFAPGFASVFGGLLGFLWGRTDPAGRPVEGSSARVEA